MAIGTTAALVGGAVLGGLIQGQAAKDAANTQASAAKDANALQYQMFQQQREDQQPWRDAGAKALGQMQNDEFQDVFSMNKFQQDPGYQFRLSEGEKAINNAAAARGMGNSGATMKALAKYNQDFASNEYTNAYNRFNNDQTNRFNRLSALAGVGQTANNAVANAGTNYANAANSNIIGMGNAQAAGQIGMANATNQALGQGMNSWLQSQVMNQGANQNSLGGGYLGSGNYAW